MKGLLGRTKLLVSKPAPSGATMHEKATHHAHERTVHENKAKELFRTPASKKAHQAIADGHGAAHNTAMAKIDAHAGVKRYLSINTMDLQCLLPKQLNKAALEATFLIVTTFVLKRNLEAFS